MIEKLPFLDLDLRRNSGYRNYGPSGTEEIQIHTGVIE